MITAKEARVLAGPSATDIISDVARQIEKAAKSGMRSITLRDDFWAHEGRDLTDLYKECVNILEDHGYQVKYFFDCGQFVDAGVVISWGTQDV